MISHNNYSNVKESYALKILEFILNTILKNKQKY